MVLKRHLTNFSGSSTLSGSRGVEIEGEGWRFQLLGSEILVMLVSFSISFSEIRIRWK